MTTLGKRLLPHDASVADYRADAVRSVFPVMTSNDIVRELVDRSGHPEAGMFVDRHAPDAMRCEACLQTPDRPVQGPGHFYRPVLARVPGTHSDVLWDRPQNSDGTESGQPQMSTSSPEILAEARWNSTANRHRPMAEQRPAVLPATRLF